MIVNDRRTAERGKHNKLRIVSRAKGGGKKGGEQWWTIIKLWILISDCNYILILAAIRWCNCMDPHTTRYKYYKYIIVKRRRWRRWVETMVIFIILLLLLLILLINNYYHYYCDHCYYGCIILYRGIYTWDKNDESPIRREWVQQYRVNEE